MRELTVVGLDVDGKHVLCEDDQQDRYKLLVEDQLRAAVRGDGIRVRHTPIDPEPKNTLRPRDIQARIRAGASVEQLARAAGVDVSRIARFANPVLLERARAAELASAAHPVLDDGPSVLTLLETITAALVSRGLDPDDTQWDSWRNEDGRWTVQIAWKAGCSENFAHFRYAPGAHGGTVSPIDEAAGELVNPRFERPLRVAPRLHPAVPELVLAEEPAIVPEPEPAPPVVERAETVQPEPDHQPELFADEPEPQRAARPARAKRSRPTVPGWEDVLLGVRSAGDR